MSSTKSMVGHPQGASGASGISAILFAMNEGLIPPTLNLQHPDPECDLDYVPNTAREMPVNAALVNSFAFGGTNGCLVVVSPNGSGA